MIVEKATEEDAKKLLAKYDKIDEIPFDFVRRRMSVIIKPKKTKSRAMIVTKGAVAEMLDQCSHVEMPDGKSKKLDKKLYGDAMDLNEAMNADGLRVVAVAYKKLKDASKAEEENLTLLGFVGFLDPPKESSAEAIRLLKEYGVEVKVLTGDSLLVCKKVCEEIDLDVKGIVSANDLAGLSLEELTSVAENGTIFARLSPIDKANVVKALRSKGHVVGFMGDGINVRLIIFRHIVFEMPYELTLAFQDALALHSADVGISVDEAVDVAKESSDIILLEKSLLVLAKAVHTGRLTYGNTIKVMSSSYGIA